MNFLFFLVLIYSFQLFSKYLVRFMRKQTENPRCSAIEAMTENMFCQSYLKFYIYTDICSTRVVDFLHFLVSLVKENA